MVPHDHEEGTIIVPADETAPAAPAAPAAPLNPPAPAANGDATLKVHVPADAVVIVNERPTSSTGSDRVYISRDLKIDAQYEYTFKVEVVRNGKTLSSTKTINVKAFDNLDVVFDFDQSEAAASVASR